MKGMYKAAGPEGRRNKKQKRELNTIDNLDKLVAKAVKIRVKQCNKKAKFEKKKRNEINAFENLDLSSNSDAKLSASMSQPMEKWT